MVNKIMAWFMQATLAVGISLSMTIAFVPEVFSPEAIAQERASKPKRATVKPLRARLVAKEAKSACGDRELTKSTDGETTTYSCSQEGGGIFSSGGGAGGAAAGTTIQADPDVAASSIDCQYSSANGAVTWLGCQCTEDGDGNCNDFISWCAEQGDEVSGNSGSASCAPSG